MEVVRGTKSTKLKVFFILIGIEMLMMTHQSMGQVQLLLLTDETVVMKFNPGEEFIYKLKDSNEINASYIRSISKTVVITDSDSIPIGSVERVYFSRPRFYNKAGAKIISTAIILFLVECVKVSKGHGSYKDTSRSSSGASMKLMGIGLPLSLSKKKSQRLNTRYRLITVERGNQAAGH